MQGSEYSEDGRRSPSFARLRTERPRTGLRQKWILAGVFVMTAMPAAAVIVDRVAVAVGNKVITESEIDQRIRLTAFQNREKLDFTLPARRAAAERLIDQRLVEREMDVGRYPRTAAAEGDGLLKDYEEENYKSDRGALDRALAAYGLTEKDLENDLVRQSDLLTFLDLRFRPAVEVTDQDIQKQAGGKPLAEIPAETRADIEDRLTTERADKELDTWLRDQRRRTKIQYADKDLGEPVQNVTGDQK